MNWHEEIKNIPGFSFGDSAEMADELGSLVVSGNKTATSGLLRLYEQDGEEVAKVGDRYCVKDSKQSPMCVIEIEKVEHKLFREVDEAFALLEGEGNLQEWQEIHRRYFSRHLKDFDESMTMVCETFKVIHRF